MTKPKIYTMTFASVYPLYIQKAERKIERKRRLTKLVNMMKRLATTIGSKVTMETFLKKHPILMKTPN